MTNDYADKTRFYEVFNTNQFPKQAKLCPRQYNKLKKIQPDRTLSFSFLVTITMGPSTEIKCFPMH